MFYICSDSGSCCEHGSDSAREPDWEPNAHRINFWLWVPFPTRRVQQLETQVAELQKAIELLLHNPNWREVISLSPSEIERWARAIRDRK
jgi:hypothetical protein